MSHVELSWKFWKLNFQMSLKFYVTKMDKVDIIVLQGKVLIASFWILQLIIFLQQDTRENILNRPE